MQSPAQQLTGCMARIYSRRLTTTSGGNLSMKDDRGNIWITPAAIDKGTLTPEDMVCLCPDGTVIGKHRPSSELPFHKKVYEMRPDLKAVIHAHPAGVLGWSMTRQCPPLIPAVRQICPRVELAGYAVPGSEALGELIGEWFRQQVEVTVMANHGLCLAARDLHTAYLQLETMEYAAQLGSKARALGKISTEGKLLPITWEPGSGDFSQERKALLAMVRRSYRQGLFTALFGDIAMKLPDGQILMTPPMVDRGTMTEDDLIVAKTAGPFTAIFAANPDVGAVYVSRPVHTMAFAVTGAAYDTRAVPESYVLLRDLLRLPNGTDGETLGRTLSQIHPAALIEGDCAVTLGQDLTQGFDRMEVLETTAQALLTLRSVGPIVEITDPEIEEIKRVFNLAD